MQYYTGILFTCHECNEVSCIVQPEDVSMMHLGLEIHLHLEVFKDAMNVLLLETVRNNELVSGQIGFRDYS